MTLRNVNVPARLDDLLVDKARKLNRSEEWVILRSLEVALEGELVAQGRAFMRGAVAHDTLRDAGA